MNVWINIGIWTAILIIAVVFEMMTPQLVSIWFAAGAVIALVLSAFGLPIWVQVLVFAVSSLTLLLIIKPIINKKAKQDSEGVTVAAESLVGEEAVVTKDILADGVGEIKERYEHYSAVSLDNEPIMQGEKVVIVELRGNKVVVKKK